MSRSIPVRLPHLALAASLAAAASSAGAATRVWPVLIGPGCNGTLQQCITGAAAGDTVRIINDDFLVQDGYTAIDEDIVIDKSLTLEAAPGIDATFASGRSIRMTTAFGGSAPMSQTVRGVTLRDGRIQAGHGSLGVGTYSVERVRFVNSGVLDRCLIEFEDFTDNDLATFRAHDNTMELRDGADVACGIRARAAGGTWAVDVRRNRIRGSVNGRFIRGIDVLGSNTGAVEIIANQVLGFGFDSGILVLEQTGTGDHTLAIEHNSVVGQRNARLGPTENGISITPSHADVFLNNNSVINGENAIRIYPGINGATDRTTGRAANNLVAFNTDRGLSIGPTAIVNRNNLVFANGFNSFSPGPGTVTADPRLQGARDPRLTSTSPARNAGSNADVNVTVPAFDADGEPRLVGTVDIGAFELNGDLTIAHGTTSANTVDNETRVLGLPGLTELENLIVTPHHDAVHGTELANTLGVYTPVAFAYSVFHENVAPMSTGRRISVMAPSDGRPRLLHTSTLANTTDRFTTVNHPALNGRPNAIAFVTHNYNPDGAPVQYHDQRIGMSYFGGSWSIDNQDPTVPMALGRTFNVAVAPVASPNAFTVTAATSTAVVRLEHPLLDDNACAAPFVSRNLGTPSSSNVAFTVDYVAGTLGAPGRWSIRAEGSGSPQFAAGTRFNVMVHGAQANACAREDGLFSNGFE